MLSVSVFHRFPLIIPAADSTRGKADRKRRTDKTDRHSVTGGYLPGRGTILHTLFRGAARAARHGEAFPFPPGQERPEGGKNR